MTTITVEDIHDISIFATIHETIIDIKDIRGSTSRIEMSRDDAELLMERLHEVFQKV